MSEDHLTERELLILVRSDVKSLVEAKSDHEGRIRVLERVSAVASGAIAVAGFMITKIKLAAHLGHN